MSKYLYQYNGKLNYKFGKESNMECHVTFDPTIIEDRFKSKEIKNKPLEEQCKILREEYYNNKKDNSNNVYKNSAVMSPFQNMALKSSLDKDERKFRLELELKHSRIKTLQEASKFLGLTESTVKKYLNELNVKLLNEVTNNLVGSTSPDAKVYK